MKICWDNLENVYITNRGNFGHQKQQTRYYYKDSCKECEEPFLAIRKNGMFCGTKCKGKYIERRGMENPKCRECNETKPENFYWRKGRNFDLVPEGLCKKCRNEQNIKWQKKNPEICRNIRRKRYTEIRKKSIEHYGNKCSCCGEKRYEFLALDHINGGGTAHKRELAKKGQNIWRWLIKNNFPEGFRILCHNCNQSLGSWGYCPHEKEKINERFF